MHKPKGRWLLFAAVLLTASALVPMAVGAGSASVPVIPSHLAAASGYANLNGPMAHILFGSPLPQVEIQPTANSTLAATLALDYLLELAPNVSNPAHPTVVAVAAPATLAKFNGTIPAGDSYVNLIATLPVYSAATSLWTDGTTVPKTTDVAQQAILDVNYSRASGSDGSPGVLVAWTVSGWPWAVPVGDELALEYVVQVASGAGFETCTGSPTAAVPDSGCAVQALSPHDAVWGSGLTALRGSGPSGSAAWVSWGQTVGGSAAGATTVTAGVYPESPGTSALVIAASADGAAAVSGSTLFLLSPGAVAGVVGTLVGDLPAYGGAAAIFVAAAGIGILWSRRRDRAIARELSA
ncbi:MAG: hypothetical protein WAN40_00910 [Thermoplasmata archaeon]